MKNQITVLNSSIRQFNNLYSLNDLHIASGGEDKHRPTFFARLDTTKELVKEIENSDVQICTSPIRSFRTGINKGTWACEELVLAYAMWISPKFHLVVLRAFLAMHKGQSQPQQLALPEERKFTFEFTEHELQTLAWSWFAFHRGVETFQSIYPAFNKLGSSHSGEIYGQAYEYQHLLRDCNKIIKRITADFKEDALTNWRVLKWVQDFDSKRRARLTSF